MSDSFGCCSLWVDCIKIKECVAQRITAIEPRTKEEVVLLDPQDCKLRKRMARGPVSDASVPVPERPRPIPPVKAAPQPQPMDDTKTARAIARRRARMKERRG